MGNNSFAQTPSSQKMTIKFPKGVYSGPIVNGFMEGKGSFSYGLGDEFMGYFEKGKRHGPGSMIIESRYFIEGFWENDKLINITKSDFGIFRKLTVQNQLNHSIYSMPEMEEIVELVENCENGKGKGKEELLEDSRAIHELQEQVNLLKSQLGEKEAAQNENDACSICLDNKRTHAYVPCGHQCVCEGCANSGDKQLEKCPICRADKTSIIRIWP